MRGILVLLKENAEINPYPQDMAYVEFRDAAYSSVQELLGGCKVAGSASIEQLSRR